MTDQTSGGRMETIFADHEPPITAEINTTDDPGSPCVRLEAGCNEFWLNAEEAKAVIAYLQRVMPVLEGGVS